MNIGFFCVYMFAVISLFPTCMKPSDSNDAQEPCIIQADSIAIAPKLLTLSDAEKIMGEPAKLTSTPF